MREICLPKLLLIVVLFCNSLLLNATEKELTAKLAAAQVFSIEKLLSIAEKNTHQDFDLAIAYTDLAISKAKEQNNLKAEFDAYKQKGRVLEFNNLLEEAIITYQKAEKIAEVSENDKQKQSIYTDLAIVFGRLTKYTKSRNYHLKSLKIAQSKNDKAGIENSYYGLATLHKNLASYDKALVFYNKVVQSTKESGEEERMYNALQYVAMTYAEAGQYDLAKTQIKKVYQGAMTLNDSVLIGTTAFDYGKILLGQDEKEAALEKFEHSLSIFENLKHYPLMSRSMFYVGEVHAQLGNLNEAGKYFETCQSYKKFMSLKSTSDLQYRMGNLYLKLNQIELAKKAFQESLEVAGKSNIKEFIQKSHQGLYEIYLQQGDINKALAHLEVSTAYKDSLINEVKLKTIRELNFQEEVRASDEEIEGLQNQKRNFTIISSLIGLALIVGFLLILLFLNRRSNETLKQKNLEIHEQNIKLKESNAVLHQFTYVAAHDLKEPVRNIGSFTSLLKRKYGSELNEEAKEYMGFVMKGANRINVLLNDLERYTSISMEMPENTRINPMENLEESQVVLQHVIKEKKVEIKVNQPLPAVKMKSEHLSILFQQLFENAIQHNEKERKIINVKAVEEGSFVLFSIEDKGKGITIEDQTKVFNLFYKEEKNWENEGTGIGLTICKNIIDKYNGEIWFEKNHDDGTTFYMRLPAA